MPDVFNIRKRPGLVFLLFCALGWGANGQVHDAARDRPIPIRRPAWSRQAKQDRNGFYRQAVALCDDYPEESRNEAKVTRDFEAMRKAGVSLLRFGIAWESIERAPGQYNWQFWDTLVALAARYRITLLPYVCYTPEWLADQPANFWRRPPRDLAKFGEFIYTIASRYRGKIHSWELWNEPDNREFWEGTAAQFAEMIKSGALAVRRADPTAVVVLGGMASTEPTPFFRSLKSDFGIEGYVDVINIHGYLETWNENRVEEYPRQIRAMAEAVQLTEARAEPRKRLDDELAAHSNPDRRLSPSPDLWMAEFGYSDYRSAPDRVTQYGVRAYFPYEHTPSYQATMLWKAHILALSTGCLSLTGWYRINDLKPAQAVIGDENNKFLGILDVSGKPKPALFALRTYTRLFDQPVRCIDEKVDVGGGRNSLVVAHCFERRDGHVIIVAWIRSPRPGEIADVSGAAPDTRRARIDLALPGSFEHVRPCFEDGTTIRAHLRIDAKGTDGSTVSGLDLTGEHVMIVDLWR